MSKDNSPEKTPVVAPKPVTSKQPITDESLSALTDNSTVRFFVAYQNYIMIVVLGLLLLGGLLAYRSYSMDKKTQEALEQLDTYTDPDQMKNDFDAEIYRIVKAAPAYAYKLANMYYDKGRYEDAEYYYDYMISEYPGSYFSELARNRLASMKRELEWNQNDKIKKIDELNAHVSPEVLFKTEAGDLTVTLAESDDPNGPANNAIAQFMALAQSGFYKGAYIYEVNDKLIKMGSTDEEGKEGARQKIPFEKTHRNNVTGVVGMMRDFDPAVTANPEAVEDAKFLNSSDSRFYVCLQQVPEFDEKTIAIGTASGTLMTDAAKKLKKGTKITDVQILRKRPHSYEPKTVK